MSNMLNAKEVLTKPNPAFVDEATTPGEPQEVKHDAPHYLLPDEVTKAEVTLPVAGKVNYDPTGENGPNLLNFADGKEDQARQDESDANWDGIPADKKAADVAAAKEEARIEVEDEAIEASNSPKAMAYKTLRDS